MTGRRPAEPVCGDRPPKGRSTMKRTRVFTGIASILLCAALLTGVLSACSGGSGSNDAGPSAAQKQTAQAADGAEKSYGTADTAADSDNTAGTASGTAAKAAAAQSKQKIIERLSYRMETLKFDDTVGAIQKLCADLGGYVQESSVGGSALVQKGALRSASFTLRIPQEKLAQWKSRAGTLATVLNFTSSSENIGDQYYDTEARLASLRTQQERLLALLKKSGSLSDIITLEKALADVSYQIEQLTGTLRGYDSLISYSTVSISLAEVVQPTEQTETPVTLWQKISQQFRYSLRALGGAGEALLVFFLGNAPVLLLLALIAAVIVWLLRRGRKRREQIRREFMANAPQGPIIPEEDPGEKPKEK